MCGGKTIYRAGIFSTFSCSEMIAGSFRAPLQAREYIPERRNAWIRIILGPGMHPWLDRVNSKS